MRIGIEILLFTSLYATTASAQIGIGRINPEHLLGDALLPAGALNITVAGLQPAPFPGFLFDDIQGLARLPNGHYLLSQGNGLDRARYYLELDAAGTYVASVVQPFTISSDVGLTDLAWDGEVDAESRVWAGRARSVMSYDWQARAFDPVIVPGSVFGLHVLANYQGHANASTIAEIDGEKVFISSDSNITSPFSNDLQHGRVNYHRLGLPLATLPTHKNSTLWRGAPLLTGDVGKTGAAFDPFRNTIWWAIDQSQSNPNPNASGVRFIEMSLNGKLTGQVFQGVREIAGEALSCDLYVDDEGRLIMAYVVNMGLGGDNPLGLDFGNDVLVEMHMRAQFGGACGGYLAFRSEPFIGSSDFKVRLVNAQSNPLDTAILLRGMPDPLGTLIPGINNCPLLLDLRGFRSLGVSALVAGESEFLQMIPDDPFLVGAEIAYQWFIPTSLSALPFNLSNAGAVRLGENF